MHEINLRFLDVLADAVKDMGIKVPELTVAMGYANRDTLSKYMRKGYIPPEVANRTIHALRDLGVDKLTMRLLMRTYIMETGDISALIGIRKGTEPELLERIIDAMEKEGSLARPDYVKGSPFVNEKLIRDKLRRRALRNKAE